MVFQTRRKQSLEACILCFKLGRRQSSGDEIVDADFHDDVSGILHQGTALGTSSQPESQLRTLGRAADIGDVRAYGALNVATELLNAAIVVILTNGSAIADDEN